MTEFDGAHVLPDPAADEDAQTAGGRIPDGFPAEPDLDEVLARLAALSPLRYERVRKAEAKALGIEKLCWTRRCSAYATRWRRRAAAMIPVPAMIL